MKTIKKLTSYIYESVYLTNNIKEIIIYAPLQSQNWKAGQFFKLQNYKKSNTKQFEPIAITAHKVFKNYISFIIKNSGESSKLSFELENNEKVLLLGPCGLPSKIPYKKKVVVFAQNVCNASMLPIVKEMKKQQCNVTYFACFKNKDDLIKKTEIENSCNSVFLHFQDNNLRTNTLLERITNNFINTFNDAEFLYSIGSIKFNYYLSKILKNFPHIKGVGNIYTPMQCMMKGVCGKCLVLDNNNNFIYTCHNQDIELKKLNYTCTNSRLSQNSLMEKLF